MAYRDFFFPPRFDVSHERGLFLLYDGQKTGDHSFTAPAIRKIAWAKHDKNKKK
jgi:hypothetical protein